MLWLKVVHILFIVTWFAGLFYLPRLFVYHAMLDRLAEPQGHQRFIVMARNLYFGIMLPSALLATLSGLWLAWEWYQFKAVWIHSKIGLIVMLWGYQGLCGKYRRQLADGINTHSSLFYRWFNEAPVLLLIAALYLVVYKPF
jgi:putative membrane protein